MLVRLGSMLAAPIVAALVAVAMIVPSQLMLALLISGVALALFFWKLRGATLAFCDNAVPYLNLRSGIVEKETRPPSDAVFHVLFFIWRLFGASLPLAPGSDR